MVQNMKKSKKYIIIYAILTLIVAIYVFFSAPNLNPLYSDGAFFWAVLITIYSLIPLALTVKPEQYTDENGKPAIRFNKNGAKPKKVLLIVLGSIWGIIILVNLIFTPLFFWGKYRDQMVEPVVKEFTADVSPIDLNQIPIVDAALAKNLADKKLGERASLGSQVVLGEPTLQNVDGKLIWAVPLQHSGFFKWASNMNGSAGYIKVSATNLNDIEYVDKYKIKIQPNSYFMADLVRNVRFGQGLFDGITDYSFELNDNGEPFWVVTTYKNECGFNLPEATGVIIVNAQTGAQQKYKINNVPDWVDRAQPEDFLINQINNKGKYIHGIFNFSNKEKYKASEGTNIVYNNGNCYVFTGITSVGVDNSATGFIMIDMVTKEPILYRMSGATESAAKESAQGKVQDLGYYATQPIILNVFDKPTYFMTLKDSANLIKKYAFVSIKDYATVGVGDTITEAKADYGKAVNASSTASDLAENPEKTEMSAYGTIDRINFTVEDSLTTYNFTILEKPNTIFKVALATSDKLPLTQKGDTVQVKYVTTKTDIMEVVDFKNMTF